ncbi:hypothetical protein VP01_5003g1 [Puccinia sorghi]|uniref:Uncharacterized protein n=1 Tax=Puccinia sorghi TaxID=27349 RepID=A0A0L6ULP0_9BASI|nr:hypothetical protein VP01_5003g1 [Puccinia sorghi]
MIEDFNQEVLVEGDFVRLMWSNFFCSSMLPLVSSRRALRAETSSSSRRHLVVARSAFLWIDQLTIQRKQKAQQKTFSSGQLLESRRQPATKANPSRQIPRSLGDDWYHENVLQDLTRAARDQLAEKPPVGLVLQSTHEMWLDEIPVHRDLNQSKFLPKYSFSHFCLRPLVLQQFLLVSNNLTSTIELTVTNHQLLQAVVLKTQKRLSIETKQQGFFQHFLNLLLGNGWIMRRRSELQTVNNAYSIVDLIGPFIHDIKIKNKQ